MLPGLGRGPQLLAMLLCDGLLLILPVSMLRGKEVPGLQVRHIGRQAAVDTKVSDPILATTVDSIGPASSSRAMLRLGIGG